MAWATLTRRPIPLSTCKTSFLDVQVQKVTQEKDKYKEKYEQSELERKKLEKKSEEERRKFEKKIDSLTNKFNTLSKELSEERELNKCLQVRARID